MSSANVGLLSKLVNAVVLTIRIPVFSSSLSATSRRINAEPGSMHIVRTAFAVACFHTARTILSVNFERSLDGDLGSNFILQVHASAGNLGPLDNVGPPGSCAFSHILDLSE